MVLTADLLVRGRVQCISIGAELGELIILGAGLRGSKCIVTCAPLVSQWKHGCCDVDTWSRWRRTWRLLYRYRITGWKMGMLGVVMGIRYVEGVDGGFVCVGWVRRFRACPEQRQMHCSKAEILPLLPLQ